MKSILFVLQSEGISISPRPASLTSHLLSGGVRRAVSIGVTQQQGGARWGVGQEDGRGGEGWGVGA